MGTASSVLNLLKDFPQFFSLHGKAFARPEFFPLEGLEDGLPRGSVVEMSGDLGGGKTELVLRFLAQNPSVRVAWVEEDFSIYPCAFPQSRVGLERVLFVDSPPNELLWSVHQMIRSGVFGVIVVSLGSRRAQSSSSKGVPLDEMALRRLQLAAEKSNVTVILLSEQPSRRGTWPISVQIQVSRSIDYRGILLNVLKYRGQKSWQRQGNVSIG